MRGHRTEPQRPEAVHELTVPDELLAWGLRPEVARTFVRPIAHEVQKLVRRGEQRPLVHHETERLLSLLEGLCREALSRGLGQMLVGFDLFTADWLGLKFTFETPSGPVCFGRDGDFAYSELHAMLASGPGPEAAVLARECKALAASVFPRAKIGAIIDRHEAAVPRCSGCGIEDAAVMLSMDTGSEYCGSCWKDLTSVGPRPEDLRSKSRKNRT
jgi:hypothetical protein